MSLTKYSRKKVVSNSNENGYNGVYGMNQYYTKIYCIGYNYHYQFGITKNENILNYPKELQWSKNKYIKQVYCGNTFILYLSCHGICYICGTIDQLNWAIITNNNYINNNNKKEIHYKIPTRIMIDNNQRIRIKRIADCLSSNHIILITENGDAYGFGRGIEGQLGTGNKKSSLKAVKIKLPNDVKAIDGACGESHSVLITTPRFRIKNMPILLNYYKRKYRLFNDCWDINYSITKIIDNYLKQEHNIGDIWVFGSNSDGQIGINEHINESLLPIKLKLPIKTIIIQVACGEKHTLLLDRKGRIWMFGDNYFGQSGCDKTDHYKNIYKPKLIQYLVKNNIKILSIACGKYHCCALDNRGRVYTWGLGCYGQVGHNSLHKRLTKPKLLIIRNNTSIITSIRCGTYNTLLLAKNGDIYIFGINSYTQCFKNNNDEPIKVPTKIDLNKYDILRNKTVYKAWVGYYCTLIMTRN